MNLRIVILPAKVLADGTHKIRIAISHKGQTRYFVTRFIVPGPEYLHDGQVVGLNNASYINQQLRIRMSKIYAICDRAKDIEYYTCSQLVQYIEDAESNAGPKSIHDIGERFLTTRRTAYKEGTLRLYRDAIAYFEMFFGKNEWSGVSMDFGLVFKYRINPLISFVPEFNLGISYFMEEIEGSEDYDFLWGAYKVNDTRTLININVPLAIRLTVPFVYLEAGARLNLNLSTSHDYEYTDRDGNNLQYYDWEDDEYKNVTRKAEDEWKVKTFIPSIMAGLGTTILINGHECDFGVRVFFDMNGIEEKDKFVIEDDRSDRIKVVKDETKIYSIQFVFNYFF